MVNGYPTRPDVSRLTRHYYIETRPSDAGGSLLKNLKPRGRLQPWTIRHRSGQWRQQLRWQPCLGWRRSSGASSSKSCKRWRWWWWRRNGIHGRGSGRGEGGSWQTRDPGGRYPPRLPPSCESWTRGDAEIPANPAFAAMAASAGKAKG